MEHKSSFAYYSSAILRLKASGTAVLVIVQLKADDYTPHGMI